MESQELLKSLCRQSWKRFKELHPDIDAVIYIDRIKRELDTIHQLHFDDYFLIITDIINWAKKHDIMARTRGSVCGSLVAYLLGLVDLDPIAYDIAFDRFLSVQRVTLPDADLDFDSRRDEVVAYIKERYGWDCVVTIANYVAFKICGVVRELCKILDVPDSDMESIAEILRYLVRGVTIKDSSVVKFILANEDLKPYRKKYPKLFDIAEHVALKVSHVGKHAAGIIISPSPVDGVVPLYRDKEGNLMAQWDKKDLESYGYVKFDILKVDALDVVKSIVKDIKKEISDFTLAKIPLDDNKIFKEIQQGRTVGAFQIGTFGLIKTCQAIQPKNLLDVITAVALYRPGSKDSVDYYVDQSKKKTKSYLLPQLEPILKTTQGICIFQEQTMEIMVQLAGFSREESDVVRRSISAKTGFGKYEKRFYDGCKANGISKEKAQELFEILRKAENYSFCKAHASSYGLLAYWTMWMKVHYPAQFLSAALRFQDDDDEVARLIRECHRIGVELLPPSINSLDYGRAIDKKRIQLGLDVVQGLGVGTIKEIVSHRPYKSMDDFFSKIQRRAVTKPRLEALIKAGCFDELAGSRETAIRQYLSLSAPKRDTRKSSVKFNPKQALFGVVKESKVPYALTVMDEMESFGFRLKLSSENDYKLPTLTIDDVLQETSGRPFFIRARVLKSSIIQSGMKILIKDKTGECEFLMLTDTRTTFESQCVLDRKVVFSAAYNEKHKIHVIRTAQLGGQPNGEN